MSNVDDIRQLASIRTQLRIFAGTVKNIVAEHRYVVGDENEVQVEREIARGLQQIATHMEGCAVDLDTLIQQLPGYESGD